MVFSYQGVELIGMTAAETKDRETVIPKAINSVPWRIGIFYVGTLIVLMSLFPWDQFSADESPFVKSFSQIGLPAAMRRHELRCPRLRPVGVQRRAVQQRTPAQEARRGRARAQGVQEDQPWSRACGRHHRLRHSDARRRRGQRDRPGEGVLVHLVGRHPGRNLELGVIVVCHLVYRRRVERGEAPASTFRLPYAKALCWATLAFLAALTVLLAFDEGQRIALYALPVWAAVLIGGYRMSSRNAAREEPILSPGTERAVSRESVHWC